VAAITWLNGGVDAAVVVDHRDQRVDHGLEPGHVPVPQQRAEQRHVRRLLGQPDQRVGVGRVAGLDPLGLRQLQLVEQDRLQLLRRAEVELPADRRVCLLLDRLDLAGELGLQVDQVVEVGADAGALHVGEHPGQRQLDVLEQHGRSAPVEVVVERAGQVGDRAGAHRLLLGDRGVGLVLAAVEGELALLDRLGAGPQLQPQVAQHEVGEVERALPGQRQVGRRARCRW
jgi:hypothetical protein